MDGSARPRSAQRADLQLHRPGRLRAGELRQQRQHQQQRLRIHAADQKAAPHPVPRTIRRPLPRFGHRRMADDLRAQPQQIGRAGQAHQRQQFRVPGHQRANPGRHHQRDRQIAQQHAGDRRRDGPLAQTGGDRVRPVGAGHQHQRDRHGPEREQQSGRHRGFSFHPCQGS